MCTRLKVLLSSVVMGRGAALLVGEGTDVVVCWPVAAVTAMGRGQPATSVEAASVVGGAVLATAGMAAVDAVPAAVGMVRVLGGCHLKGTERIASLFLLVGRGVSVRLLRVTRDGVGRLALRTSRVTA